MMTAQRAISVRRRTLSPEKATSSRWIDSDERPKRKPHQSHLMAWRRRVIKSSLWLRAQSFYNVGALLVLLVSLASLAFILLSNFSATTTGPPKNAKSMNAVFQTRGLQNAKPMNVVSQTTGPKNAKSLKIDFQTTSPQNAKSMNVVVQKDQMAGGSTFRSPNNKFVSDIPTVNVVFQNSQSGSTFRSPNNRYISDIPSYGDLVIDTLDKDHFRREIKFDPESFSHYLEGRGLQRPDNSREERYASEYGRAELPGDDDEDQGECQRVTWRSTIYPNCNFFHALDEVNAGTSNGEKLKYLGSGHYRSAWLVNNEATGDQMVLKQLKLPTNDGDTDHTVNPQSFSKVQRDVIVMERLTASPRIVGAYGYCGTSILAESMPFEVSQDIIPGTGKADQEDLDNLPSLRSANNYTVEEKLEMAIEMSEAIADLHGASGGVIVHGDVHPVQWLRAADGKLKLNDFNGCEILDWNVKEQRSCKANRGAWGGMYRSPEEYRGDDFDEKIDVYSMGNNIYTLMTGLWPFYEEDRYSPVIKLVKQRVRPYVDPRWRSRSYIENQFVEIMEKMWRHSPEERPDIFTVVEFLKDVKRHVAKPDNATDADEAEKTEDTEEAVEHTDTSKEGEEVEEDEEVEKDEEVEEDKEVEEDDEAEESEKSEVDSNESRSGLRKKRDR